MSESQYLLKQSLGAAREPEYFCFVIFNRRDSILLGTRVASAGFN